METKEKSQQPLQVLSYKEKLKDKKKWFKENIDYFISKANFGKVTSSSLGKKENNNQIDLELLYKVYNSQFPLEFFSHIIDPLSAKNPQHKNFPAKIRPVSMIRTNIDLMLAEYPRRPFLYQVNNMSDDAYSKYQEELKETMFHNVENKFKLYLVEEMMKEGLINNNGEPVSEEAIAEIQERQKNFKLPDEIQNEFIGSYRDKVAVQAQKWLDRYIKEAKVQPILNKLFKDWLIAGQVRTYKAIDFDNLRYERISPLNIDYDRSPNVEYIEDGEWVVVKYDYNISTIVDKFYEDLKKEDLEALQKTNLETPSSFYNFFTNTIGTDNNNSVNIPVYHVQWKGKRKLGFLTKVNPETGQVEEITVDEDYIVNKEADEKVEWVWVNEVYEGWRINTDLYLKMDSLPVQRNALNNFSYCKLSYNGKNFSDTHAENISILTLGIPFQIMYMIVTRSIELTIAKSKGKIILLDKNVIPTDEGWSEEKFFYYTESLGWALLDRNKMGVDKSFNQYQVLDMTLFDSIRQLIDLQDYFKNQWDELIGINRQRKGQTYVKDGLGVNERAVFQSTVITDTIFNLFEEFVEREMQGFIDYSKFLNASGLRKMWYDTEIGNQILLLNPDDYCNAELGILVDSSSSAISLKNKIEANVTAMLQNKMKASTMLEILQSNNITALKQKVLQIEAIEQQQLQQQQQAEQQAIEQADARKAQMMNIEKENKKELINTEYDRKEEIERIRGTYNTFTYQDGDANDNNTYDAIEASKIELERKKVYYNNEQHKEKMAVEREKIKKQNIKK